MYRPKYSKSDNLEKTGSDNSPRGCIALRVIRVDDWSKPYAFLPLRHSTIYPSRQPMKPSKGVLSWVYILEVAGYLPGYDQNNHAQYPGTYLSMTKTIRFGTWAPTRV